MRTVDKLFIDDALQPRKFPSITYVLIFATCISIDSLFSHSTGQRRCRGKSKEVLIIKYQLPLPKKFIEMAKEL